MSVVDYSLCIICGCFVSNYFITNCLCFIYADDI